MMVLSLLINFLDNIINREMICYEKSTLYMYPRTRYYYDSFHERICNGAQVAD